MMRKSLSNSTGSVQIVEAAFVFPIMFIILFFLIYMGNSFYIRAQVDEVVETYALKGAAYCADPMLETYIEKGKIPTLDQLSTEPYRYIFGGASDIERKIGNEVESKITGQSSTFFKNMSPKLKTWKGNIAKYNNYVIYGTFSVEVEYALEFPIRFLGSDRPEILRISSRAEVPVNDTPEFIRNTDMVIDVFEGTKVGQAISDVFKKINDFLKAINAKSAK